MLDKQDNKPVWYYDYYRTTDDTHFVLMHFLKDFLFQHRTRFIIYFRKAQNSKWKTVRLFCNYKLFRYSRKYAIEIKSNTKIGKGFTLTHPYNITITPLAIIGENVSVMKGATIGLSGGKRKGAPKIGNRVYVGIYSTIIGGVVVGDDVMIAPNAFINQDIPSHSVVIGNPCIVIHKDNATEQYIWKVLD